MKRKKLLNKGILLGFEPRTLSTISARLFRSATVYVYIVYFCATLMITMNDIDVSFKYTCVSCLYQCTRLV